jgi:arylsulfatase A-like enzyme
MKTIKRREFISAGLGAAGLIAARRARCAPRRPNVLFILNDDQRRDTIHALGNNLIRTPTYDDLVAGGAAFRNAYCMGGNSGAVCLPSRKCILRGVSWFKMDQVRWWDPCLPKTMNQAGYVSFSIGKTGNNDQRSLSFFHHRERLQPSDNAARAGGEPDRYLADRSLDFLRRWKQGRLPEGRRPFFMYLAGGSPHDPRVAPRHYLDLYPLDKIAPPPNLLPFHPFDIGDLLVRDERLAPWPRDEETIRRHLRDYYAVITYQDEQCARVLNELREMGEYDNTVIVFSSDNGLALGSHGLMGKQNLYEHSMGVPLVMRGPGVPAGRIIETPVYLFDIYPTLCELAGVPIPRSLEGMSLAPVLRDAGSGRDRILLGYKDLQRAVRRGEWKLIVYPQVGMRQLFNLAADPYETVNLADDPAQARRLKDMLLMLADEAKKWGDTLPLTVAHPRKASIGLDYFSRPN